MKKFILALLATAAMAMAESHTHDGFFLNLALGFGYQGFTYDANKAIYDMEAKGVSTEFDLKLGGCIATNTLLHATILGVTNNSEIDYKTKGGKKQGSSSEESENLSMLNSICRTTLTKTKTSKAPPKKALVFKLQPVRNGGSATTGVWAYLSHLLMAQPKTKMI